MIRRAIFILCTTMICGLHSIFAQQKQDSTIQNDNTCISRLLRFFAVPAPQLEIGYVSQSTSSINLSATLLKDTYLSPNDYIGVSVGYVNTSIKPLEWYDTKSATPKGSLFAYMPHKKVQNFITLGESNFIVGTADNKAGNRSMSYFDVDLRKSVLYNLSKGYLGSIYIGGGLNFNIGSIYNGNNGNNPASLNLNSSIIASALYHYRLPYNSIPIGITLIYSSSLAGFTFSPQYGESYYEIFSLKNNGLFKNLYFTSMNRVLNNRIKLSIDIPALDIMVVNLSVFYNGYISKINMINKNIENIGFSLGFTGFKQKVSGRKIYTSDKYQIPL